MVLIFSNTQFVSNFILLNCIQGVMVGLRKGGTVSLILLIVDEIQSFWTQKLSVSLIVNLMLNSSSTHSVISTLYN